MELLVGIDIGTGSTKGVVTSVAGEVLATEQLSHELSLPRPGWAEMDAEGVWWAEVGEICRRLMLRVADLSPRARIAGVGVCGVGPCLVLCDADLRPLRPAILYGIDTRAGAEIVDLTERYGAEEILASGGKSLSSQAIGPKLEWVRRHEPEVWRQARSWHGCHTWVVAKLTGAYVLDHTVASQCDPLYRVPDFGWHRDWASEICAPMGLPQLAWPADVVGTVHAEAAALTGLPVGTPVVAGTVDALAESFSAGVRAPGDMMIMYGSTMFLTQVLGDYATAPDLWTTVGVEPDTYVLAAGTATAGSLTRWLQQLVGPIDYPTLAAEAATVLPGSDGLMMLPYFAGERTPHFDPDARGLIAGLTLRHTRAHLFRACYEGIAYGVRQILDRVDSAGTPTRRTVAVGGGVHAPLWLSIMSDVTGRVQQVPRYAIGASYGAALLAAIGTGRAEPHTDWTEIAETVHPDPGLHRFYAELYPTWSELYPATRGQVHRLAHLPDVAGSPDLAGSPDVGAPVTRPPGSPQR